MAMELFKRLEELEKLPKSIERDILIADTITKLEQIIGL